LNLEIYFSFIKTPNAPWVSQTQEEFQGSAILILVEFKTWDFIFLLIKIPIDLGASRILEGSQRGNVDTSSSYN
jgi:hypothetical protein